MWFVLSFGSALFNSLKDVFGKKSIARLDEYSAAWSQRFFALIVLVPLMIWYWPARVDGTFWLAWFIIMVLGTAASILYMKALKHSPLSLVLPIVSLTPLFVLLTSHLINHELPQPLGIVGVIVTVVGAYVLQWSKRAQGFFKPFTSMVSDRGSLMMLGVAILWGVTSPYDKIAIQHSSVFFYIGMANVGFTLTLLPFILLPVGRWRKIFNSKEIRYLGPIGLGQVGSIVLQMLALPLTFVSYVTAVKLSSSMFGPLWGKLFFQEEKIKERLLGTVVILLGIILMVVA